MTRDEILAADAQERLALAAAIADERFATPSHPINDRRGAHTDEWYRAQRSAGHTRQEED